MKIRALSFIRRGMAEIDRPRFNLRLTPELERLLAQSTRRTGRSKNAEILRALEWHLRPDPARQLAEAMKPLLDTLSADQLEALTNIVQTMARRKRK